MAARAPDTLSSEMVGPVAVVAVGLGLLALRARGRDGAAVGAEPADEDDDKSKDTVFFPAGDGDWIGFPSGETLDTEDLPYEPMDPSVPIASGVGSAWTGCCAGYATGQLVNPYGVEPWVTRDEAFEAASRLSSMFPNIRALVAQAPDGFYVRVITQGGGGLGFGGYGNLFGPQGLRRQPAGRGGDDWSGVFRAMDRIPAQIGRVRVQIDRLVSPDFAVAGCSSPTETVTLDEARVAQDQLRSDLLGRCLCVLHWMRGVGLGYTQPRCGPGCSERDYHVELLVDGSKMSDEARQMVAPLVGRVPVQIRDIGTGPVPTHMEIVAP